MPHGHELIYLAQKFPQWHLITIYRFRFAPLTDFEPRLGLRPGKPAARESGRAEQGQTEERGAGLGDDGWWSQA